MCLGTAVYAMIAIDMITRKYSLINIYISISISIFMSRYAISVYIELHGIVSCRLKVHDHGQFLLLSPFKHHV